MTLRVIESNERAAKLYESRGYTKKSEEYEIITTEEDGETPSKVKVIYMEKRI
jgi:ribosomal protein S18 acetylase RimI-like enzyme